ncbi:LOW QUALITY PROTEIN: L-xylulose reductase [Paramyrothecium foliicola]|nr:LOW QUALITY PROTEIN: L-xylulose reductase [Paramyrothecium foliicola]
MASKRKDKMVDLKDGSFPHNNMPVPVGDRVLPMFSLKGRTAIVSGAGAGIGLGIAHALAEAGANVAIWYNSNKQALERASEIEKIYGVKSDMEGLGKAYQVDVITLEAVEQAINEIVKEFNGRLDVFVANSGIAWEDGDFIDGPAERARKVMTVNVDGVMWCAKAAGAHFRRQKKEGTTLDGKPLENFLTGSFIATASMSGSIVNIPQLQAVYNSSKAAVIHFCKSLAVEWTGFARVNTVSPGYIKTEISDFAPPEMKAIWKNKTVMGFSIGVKWYLQEMWSLTYVFLYSREGEVSELKGAYLYLASDASSYTTGLDMIVDGGYCAP